MEGKEDNTHLRPEGARWVASTVADKLSKLVPFPSFLALEDTAVSVSPSEIKFSEEP